MDKIIIRKATLRDLKTLLEFEQNLILAERPFDPTLKNGYTTYYNIEEMIEASDVEVAVAELDNKIIGSGYAWIKISKPYFAHKRYSYLGLMYVVPEHRGKGLNNRIIEFLKRWTTSQHIDELRLDVYVQNTSAIKAYEKFGFSKHMVEMRMSV